jgi:hypothetical protein
VQKTMISLFSPMDFYPHGIIGGKWVADTREQPAERFRRGSTLLNDFSHMCP